MNRWLEPNKGTWIIKGIFDDAKLLENSSGYIDTATGEGTIVYTYDKDGAVVYSSGEQQHSFHIVPEEGDIRIVSKGLGLVENLEYIPEKLDSTEALSRATGDVSVDQWLLSLGEWNDEGIWLDREKWESR